MADGSARVERSAGGVVVRRVDGEIRVLIIRDPYHLWGLPKGHLEEGEELSEAAVREVREETGLRGTDVGPKVATIDWFFRNDGDVVHKFCTFYLVHAPEGDPEPELAEGITECVWLPLNVAVERVSYDNAREVVREAGRLLREDPAPFALG